MSKRQGRRRIYLPFQAVPVIVLVLCLCAALGNVWLKENYPEAFVENEESWVPYKEEQFLTADGLYSYTIKADNTVKIISYMGEKEKNVVVPDEIENCVVNEIGESAFSYHEELETIQFPDTITTIKMAAFGNSYNLREVYFQGNLLSDIEEYAFLEFHGVVCAPETSAVYNYAKQQGVSVMATGEVDSTE